MLTSPEVAHTETSGVFTLCAQKVIEILGLLGLLGLLSLLRVIRAIMLGLLDYEVMRLLGLLS